MNTTVSKILLVTLILISGTALSQSELHTPAEILSIVTNSEIVYELNPDTFSNSSQEIGQLSHDLYYQAEENGELHLKNI